MNQCQNEAGLQWHCIDFHFTEILMQFTHSQFIFEYFSCVFSKDSHYFKVLFTAVEYLIRHVTDANALFDQANYCRFSFYQKLLKMYQLFEINYISVHILVHIDTRFGAFPAPSSGTLNSFSADSTRCH